MESGPERDQAESAKVWETGEAEEIKRQEYQRSLEGLGIWDTGEDTENNETGQESEISDEALTIQRGVWNLRVDLFMNGDMTVEGTGLSIWGRGIEEEAIDEIENPDAVLLTITKGPKKYEFRRNSVTTTSQGEGGKIRTNVINYNQVNAQNAAPLNRVLTDSYIFINPTE